MQMLRILPITLAVSAFALGISGGALAANGDGTGPAIKEAAAETTAGDPAPATLGDRVDGFVAALSTGDDEALAGHVCLDRLRGMALAEGQTMGLIASGADVEAIGRRYDIAYLASVHDTFDGPIAAASEKSTSGASDQTPVASPTPNISDGGILGALRNSIADSDIMTALAGPGEKSETTNPLIKSLLIETVETANLAGSEKSSSDADGVPIAVVGAVRLTLVGAEIARDIPVLKIADGWCLNPVSVPLIDLEQN